MSGEGPASIDITRDSSRQWRRPGRCCGTGRFVECLGDADNRDAARLTKDAYERNHLAARNEGRHRPGSVLCAGWFAIRIEEHPGRDYPATRPVYS